MGFSSGGFGFSGDFGNFSDIFGDIFGDLGGRRGGNSSQQGSDLRYDISITLEEAYNGVKEEIEYKANFACDGCGGAGSTSGAKKVTCMSCGGRGSTVRQQGFFAVEQQCVPCGGMGKIIKDPCKKCHGSGRYARKESMTVSIPRGMDEGSKMRVSGAGESGVRGAAAGDLYIFIILQKHKFFKRSGNDLHCLVPIKMTTAALGGEINVPGIDGKLCKITVPSGTQPGHQLKLRGKGMPVMRSSSYGDLFVKIEVEIPSGMSDHQKSVLKKFDVESEKEDSNLFSKVKKFLSDLK